MKRHVTMVQVLVLILVCGSTASSSWGAERGEGGAVRAMEQRQQKEAEARHKQRAARLREVDFARLDLMAKLNPSANLVKGLQTAVELVEFFNELNDAAEQVANAAGSLMRGQQPASKAPNEDFQSRLTGYKEKLNEVKNLRAPNDVTLNTKGLPGAKDLLSKNEAQRAEALRKALDACSQTANSRSQLSQTAKELRQLAERAEKLREAMGKASAKMGEHITIGAGAINPKNEVVNNALDDPFIATYFELPPALSAIATAANAKAKEFEELLEKTQQSYDNYCGNAMTISNQLLGYDRPNSRDGSTGSRGNSGTRENSDNRRDRTERQESKTEKNQDRPKDSPREKPRRESQPRESGPKERSDPCDPCPDPCRDRNTPIA
jgi:hypothetical protein